MARPASCLALLLALWWPSTCAADACTSADEVLRLRRENEELRRLLRDGALAPRALAEVPTGEIATAEGGVEDVEREEEEEEFTQVDIVCSWMLLGSLFFSMVIFYLVNYQDHDIKRYAWSIIVTTLSIFTAVLIFSGIDELFVEWFVEPVLGEFATGSVQIVRVACGFLIFLIWFVVTHLVVAYFSNVLTKRKDSAGKQWVVSDGLRGDHGDVVDHQLVRSGGRFKSVTTIDCEEVFVCHKNVTQEGYERRTKCWAMLYAHMTGFAMISAGGDLQHSPPFTSNWGLSFVSVLINAAFLLLLFRISNCFRREAEDDDDECEREAFNLCKEESIEAEDDIFSLATSFLLVQAIRFSITGVLPDKLGAEPEMEYSAGQTAALYVAGILLCVMTAALAFFGGKDRLLNLALGTCSMGFAWCVLFATKWMFVSWTLLTDRKMSPKTIEGRIVLSLTLSLLSCGVIIILDKIEDSNTDVRQVARIVKYIITGLSILIGFTWEHSFDGCVEAISSQWEDPLLVKLVGTFLIALIVIPAWRRYILQKVVDLNTAKEARREALKEMQDGDSRLEDDEGSSEGESSALLGC